ncbi:MAG: lysine-2,3-aminomutase-like protein [Pseudomonadota bacterium]|nr:lysine-2,3-aminomutase-like protein [Pseudomonadota bacterium]
MTRTLHSPEDLVRAGLVSPGQQDKLVPVAEKYAIAITPAMAALIRPDDPDDPIARQFVPDTAELHTSPEEVTDPIGDAAHSPLPGLVHRYPDRVLLKLLHACPVYCRFCFRREMVGPGGESMSAKDLDAALGYIHNNPQIREVILTGGDPLMLSPRRMADIVKRLDAIAHLDVIRLHTRVPVVDPDRVTEDLVSTLKTTDSAVWMAIHTNHPRELTSGAVEAIRRLADAGIALVAQTVLLRGVNDDPAVLEELFRRLVRARVKPYYLHHPDLAPGTARFRLSLEEGQRIMAALRGRVSGLCQPTYVLDIPDGYGKVPVGPSYLEGSDVKGWIVRDPWGHCHSWPLQKKAET